MVFFVSILKFKGYARICLRQHVLFYKNIKTQGIRSDILQAIQNIG